MHAERDYLVKRVFPQVRERLLPYRIHLIDIDLRWGITKEEAENDRVLDLCLQQIDECRPFFVGILGERYGWVPQRMPSLKRPEYGWIQGATGKSMTELEIMHGVLRNPQMKGHAFFYFRDPKFVADIPPELRPDYKDAGSPDRKLVILKNEIRQSRFPVIDPYPARWDAVNNHVTGLDAFGDQVLADLWDAIKAEYELLDEPPAYDSDTLAEERDFHERFIESRTKVYVGRESVLAELVRFADRDGNKPCIVTGPSGSGKSAALAKFVVVYQKKNQDVLIIPHFIGASPRSTGLRSMLRRFCEELRNSFGYDDEIPFDLNKLATVFHEFLQRIPNDRRVLLVIDALNQLDETDNSHSFYWLPLTFPSHVKVVVSSIDDPGRKEAALIAIANRPCERVEIGKLTPEERFAIATEVPSVSAKKLDPEQMNLLLSNRATENPLFLLVALEELRGFGTYEDLNNRITQLPAGDNSVTKLFVQVIERLEQDFETETVRSVLSLLACARHGLSEAELFEIIEGHDDLTCSATDLFVILRQLRTYLQQRSNLLDFFHRDLYRAARARYLDGEQTILIVHRDLAMFFHRVLNPPGAEPFTGIAPHALSELPFHQTKAKMSAELQDTLSNLAFLEAKCSHCYATSGIEGQSTYEGVYHLLDDLAQALNTPDLVSKDSVETFCLLYEALIGEAYVLRRRPYILPQQLHNCLVGKTGPSGLQTLIERAIDRQGVAKRPWFKKFLFKNRQGEGARKRRALAVGDTMYGNLAIGPHGLELASTDSQNVILWDLASGKRKASFYIPEKGGRRPPHIEDRVAYLAWHHDGSQLVSVGYDGVVCTWDPQALQMVSEWDTEEGLARACLSPDKHLLLSISPTGAAIWHITERRRLCFIEEENINAGVFSRDGKHAYLVGSKSSSSASVQNNKLWFWDIHHGHVETFVLPELAILTTICAFPDREEIAVGDYLGTVAVLDPCSQAFSAIFPGQQLARKLKRKLGTNSELNEVVFRDKVEDLAKVVCPKPGLTHAVRALAISSDGKCLAAGTHGAFRPGELALFELANRKLVRRVYLPRRVQSVAYTPDEDGLIIAGAGFLSIEPLDQLAEKDRDISFGRGRYLDVTAASPDGDYYALASLSDIHLIPVAPEVPARRIFAHAGTTHCLDWHPNGGFLASGGSDGLSRVWNVASAECRAEFSFPESEVRAVKFTKGGRSLCMLGSNGLIAVADWENGPARKFGVETETSWDVAAVSHEGILITGGSLGHFVEEETVCQAWELSTGLPIASLKGHKGRIVAVGVDKQGVVATVSDDNSLRLWSAATGEQLHLWNVGNNMSSPIALACLPNSKRVVVSCTNESCTLWARDSEYAVAFLPIEMPAEGLFIIEVKGCLMIMDALGRRTYFELDALNA